MNHLRTMHPKLLPASVADLLQKVAVGLNRHSHRNPVACEIEIDHAITTGSVTWPDQNPVAETLDVHRVTEDAAEAIALGIAHAAHGWVVRRRAQREEHADWLLQGRTGDPIALEVSGVDIVDQGMRRLSAKVQQVKQHSNPKAMKVACVVALNPPRCRMRQA